MRVGPAELVQHLRVVLRLDREDNDVGIARGIRRTRCADEAGSVAVVLRGVFIKECDLRLGNGVRRCFVGQTADDGGCHIAGADECKFLFHGQVISVWVTS